MNKKSEKFSAVATYDELESDDLAVNARRLACYSKEALKVGLPIDRIFVLHTRFANAIRAMDRIFQIAPEVEMAHGLRLIGPSGVGKSAVFKYFRDSLPSSNLFAPGYGAVGIRLNRSPTTGQMVAALLKAYRYPFSTGSGSQMYIKRHLVFDAIRQKGTRLLFIDEGHHFLRASHRNPVKDEEISATEFLNELIDECRLAVVIAGTNTLDRLATTDSHLLSRVAARYELCNFPADGQWMGLLKGFIKICQTYDLSFLEDEVQAKLLHMATNGNLRLLKNFLTEIVLVAFDDKQAKPTQDNLKVAFQRIFGDQALVSNVYA